MILMSIYLTQSGVKEEVELPVEWLVYERESSIRLFGSDIDLLTGRFKIQRDTEHIAETVCLGFALSALITLCLPSVYKMRKSKRFFCTCTNEEDNLRDHEMLNAVGYGLEVPSNDWLAANMNTQNINISSAPNQNGSHAENQNGSPAENQNNSPAQSEKSPVTTSPQSTVTKWSKRSKTSTEVTFSLKSYPSVNTEDSATFYSWHQTVRPESRESSFEMERNLGGYVNRSFDSGSETKF